MHIHFHEQHSNWRINVTLSQFIFILFCLQNSNSLNLNYLFNLQNWNVICDNDAFFEQKKDHLFAMLKRKDERREEKKNQPWKFGRGVNHQQLYTYVQTFSFGILFEVKLSINVTSNFVHVSRIIVSAWWYTYIYVCIYHIYLHLSIARF